MLKLAWTALGALALAHGATDDHVELPTNIAWPLPAVAEWGNATICVDAHSLELSVKNGACAPRRPGRLRQSSSRRQLLTARQSMCDDLHEAFGRMRFDNFAHQTVDAEPGACATEVVVSVQNTSTVLDFGVDESYSLHVSKEELSVSAETVYGAMRGLETLSQLMRFNSARELYEIANTPWDIKDAPRFPHRELLVDTGRHYLPVRSLERVIDSMPYAKVNVLHFHLEDDQSFPFCSERLPEFCTAASFSANERYTRADLVHLVEYARRRGVRVMPEIDLPGHTRSWCVAYPDICEASGSLLSPTSNRTLEVIGTLLEEVAEIFPDTFMHLGGDEVNENAWAKDPEVVAWMKARNYTTKDVYLHLVQGAHEAALRLGKSPVGWSEIWSYFRTSLNPRSVLEKWRGGDSFKDMTSSGYQAIYAPDTGWYLDHLWDKWEHCYNMEPCESLSDEECGLVIGGGGEMWGETVDTSDVLQTIWPRMGAIAERLWTPRHRSQNADKALPRITEFRCLLNRRGVPAAPVAAGGRDAPPRPGACMDQ